VGSKSGVGKSVSGTKSGAEGSNPVKSGSVKGISISPPLPIGGVQSKLSKSL
jgi:hypothetical protein